MDSPIIAVFCICADRLGALHHYEDPQCSMSDVEIMTTVLVAVLYFSGNYARSVITSAFRAPVFTKTKASVATVLARNATSMALNRIH
mgnify:CR=1 FL=1